jgi:signal transduction histidine kinase
MSINDKELSIGEHPVTHWIAVLCLLFILIASVSLFVIYRTNERITACGFPPLFGMSSTIIVIGLFGLYWYAARFYNDSFYRLISIGWLANAVYIFFETFIDKPQSNLLTFKLGVYGLGLLTALPFFVASFIPKGEEPNYQVLFKSMSGWAAWLVSTFIICYLVATVYFPLWIQDSNNLMAAQFAFIAAGGIPFVVWTLVQVGNSLGSRLDPETHKRWAQLFPITFYAYAVLQPFYLLTLVPGMDNVSLVLFSVALGTKVVNSLGIMSIINYDFASVQRQLQQRSFLEDLGALTASIEHDVKNPLEVLNAELERMRARFQNNSDVLVFVERLEEQKVRIAATAQIIPVIRGERAFYEKFMEKTNVGDLINRSIKAVRKELNTERISFRPVGRAVHTKAYRPMLEQAVVNILRNAVEAIRDAKREHGVVDIAIKIDPKDNRSIRVDFVDNGCGIPEQDLSSVTTLFMSTKGRTKPNSGIGLFITSRIMRFHRGRIEIKSDENKGTTVSLFMPIWDDGTKPIQKRRSVAA